MTWELHNICPYSINNLSEEYHTSEILWYTLLGRSLFVYHFCVLVFVCIIYIDGLVQDCSNSIANALESLQSCAKPSICSLLSVQFGQCVADMVLLLTMAEQFMWVLPYTWKFKMICLISLVNNIQYAFLLRDGADIYQDSILLIDYLNMD